MKNVFLIALVLVVTISSINAQDAQKSFYVSASAYPQTMGMSFKAGQTVEIKVSGQWYSNGKRFSYIGESNKDRLAVRPNVNVMALLIEIRDGDYIFNDDFSNKGVLSYTFKHGGHINFACNDDLWTPAHKNDNHGKVKVTMSGYNNFNGSTKIYQYTQNHSSFIPPSRSSLSDLEKYKMALKLSLKR